MTNPHKGRTGLDQLLTDVARPLDEVDAAVQEEILALAMALARQIVRRELRSDPTQIIGIVREALSQLPVAARDVRVQLHPEDAAIVREHLAPVENERAWTLVEDPMMMRGGCQVVSASSRVDVRMNSTCFCCSGVSGPSSLDSRIPAMLVIDVSGVRNSWLM